MRSIKLSSFAGSAVLLGALCSQAFAWSISGIVQDKATGAPLADVQIAAYNYGGFATTTAADGKFSLSSETTSIASTHKSSMDVQFSGNMLSLNNIQANVLKVSMMDALGKVIYQRSLQKINGFVTLDMSKYTARGVKFARINIDGSSSSYMLTNKGVLLKEGDVLPVFMFKKDGYQIFNYTMTSENEPDVLIQMEAGSSNPTSSAGISSSSQNTIRSSSSAKSSSSKDDTPVDCTGKTYQAGDHPLSVKVDGKDRTFIMHVPSSYKGDKPVPMLVDYHPIGGSGSAHLSASPYKEKTDPEGVITLYPDGTPNPVGNMAGSNGWNVGPCCSSDDDIKFSREMINYVETKVCIDKKRIYAAGYSMGGGMSNHVACFMSDVYAAVAPASMDLNTENSAICSPERPISVIMFRGSQDFVCSYNGGDSGQRDNLNFLGAKGNFKFWGDKNGCNTTSSTRNSDGCEEYTGCKDGVRVVLCTDNLVGAMGPNNHSYGNASIGWPFLKQFTLP